jgi:hypothetical protein
MSINVGITGDGKSHRALRLTMSEEDFRLAKTYWGDTPRVSYTAEALGDGRWLLIFRGDRDGNGCHVQRPPSGDKSFMSWHWGARNPNTLLGMPGIRARAHRGELLRWNDDGSLEIIVRGRRDRPRKAPAPRATPAPAPAPVPSTATSRLAALKTGINHAIAELARSGMSVRVSQARPGEAIEMNIDL